MVENDKGTINHLRAVDFYMFSSSAPGQCALNLQVMFCCYCFIIQLKHVPLLSK